MVANKIILKLESINTAKYTLGSSPVFTRPDSAPGHVIRISSFIGFGLIDSLDRSIVATRGQSWTKAAGPTLKKGLKAIISYAI